MRSMASSMIPFGRPMVVASGEASVVLRPAVRAGWSVDEESLVLDVSPDVVAALVATLPARRGTCRVVGLDGVTFAVVPSEIRDAGGNVIETVG